MKEKKEKKYWEKFREVNGPDSMWVRFIDWLSRKRKKRIQDKINSGDEE